VPPALAFQSHHAVLARLLGRRSPMLASLRDPHCGRQRIEKLTMQKASARLRLSLRQSLPSIVFPVRNNGPAAASPDPRYETQRGRNADGEKDLHVVIHDNLQSLQLTPGGLAPKIC
jgi:hypothetical protein